MIALLHTTSTLFLSFWKQHFFAMYGQAFCQYCWRHFYLRLYVNQHVYREFINAIPHLKHRITDAIHSITPYVFISVLEELEQCLDVCRAWKEVKSKGAEQVWNVQKFSFTWGRFLNFHFFCWFSCYRSNVHH